MLDIFVEEIIIFPADFSEDLIIRESEHLEISLIRDIGMKSSYSRNLEKLPEENCLPSEYELCMKVNNIWLELENLSQNPWCEGEGEPELRIEECRKTADREDLDSRTGELFHSGILRNDNTDLMSTLDQFA